MTAYVFTLEATLTVDAIGTQQTFYASTRGFTTAPTDTPANTVFRPLLKDPGSVRRELFSGARVTGAVRPTFGQIVLANLNGEYDAWTTYGVGGGKITLRYGPEGGAYPAAFTTVLVAYAFSIIVDFKELRLVIRDRSYLLDKPVVSDIFAGSGGVEGVGAKGKKKQMVFGQPGYVPLIPLDTAKLTYFVQANAPDAALQLGLSADTTVYDGGVALTREANYSSEAEFLSTYPSSGCFRVWSPVSNVGLYVLNGPVYVRLGSPPAQDLRIGAHGRYTTYIDGPTPTATNTAGVYWYLNLLAERAGVAGATVSRAELPGTLAIHAGHRLVDDDQTYLDVMNDACRPVFGAFGFTRLDQFFMIELLDPSETGNYDDSIAFNFTPNNSKNFTRQPIPGMESPSTQVAVSAGRVWVPSMNNGASPTIRDAMTRTPWQTVFTGSASAVKVANPGAQSDLVQINSNSFPDTGSQQNYVNRYFQLYGGRRDYITLDCLQFDATTIGLELGRKVTLTMPRFGCNAGRTFRIVTITMNLKARSISFGLWGGDIGPAASVLGSAAAPQATGYVKNQIRMGAFRIIGRAKASAAAGIAAFGQIRMGRFALQAKAAVGAVATVWNSAEKGAAITLSGVNRIASLTSSSAANVNGTMAKFTGPGGGKYYFEVLIGGTPNTSNSNSPAVGICPPGLGASSYAELINGPASAFNNASAISFNGTSSQLIYAASPDFNQSASDFSVECEFWRTDSNSQSHICQLSTDVTHRWSIAFVGASTLIFYQENGGAPTTISTSCSANAKHTVKVEKVGGTISLYLDGSLAGSRASALPPGNLKLSLGTQEYSPIAADWYGGLIKNFKVTKAGTTVLDLRADGADGSTTITDSSASARTPTTSAATIKAQVSAGYARDGTKAGPGLFAGVYFSTYTAGDVIGVAFDATNGKVWFAKNNTWQGSGDPAAGTFEAFSALSGSYVPMFAANIGMPSGTISASLADCAYTPPSGFTYWA